jgi:hypothetical protein
VIKPAYPFCHKAFSASHVAKFIWSYTFNPKVGRADTSRFQNIDAIYYRRILMAKISIANLNANESKFSRLPLGETELIKTAVERALDTRRIGGGKGIIGFIKFGYFLN